MIGSRPDADQLAELEEERRFLLRSISDLDREHEAGDVDAHDYVALRDGYTARAATVLRAIDDGKSVLPERPQRSWRRLTVVVATVVVAAALAGWLVARSTGQRLPGDSITGGTSPNEVATLLSEGRKLLEVDPGQASERYLAVLDIEPDNVEALTYAGWLVALSSRGQAGDAQRLSLDASKEFLNDAIAIDPTYADPYCFLAIIADSIEGDPKAALELIDSCVINNPPAQLRALIESFRQSLDERAGPTTTTSP